MNKSRFIILIAVLLATSLCGCVDDSEQTSRKVAYEKTILTKSECIGEVKALLGVSELHFFDCDFTKMASIEVSGISHNISVTGNLVFDGDRYVLDQNYQADIKIITNYSVRTGGNYFGFSLLRNVMIPKVDSKNPNTVFDAATFQGVKGLHNNGKMNYMTGHICLTYIDVPQGFFTAEQIEEGIAVSTDFLKISGDIDDPFDDIKILCNAASIFAYYESDEGAQKNFIFDLIDFFTQNATYLAH